jgi:hypothetical protein
MNQFYFTSYEFLNRFTAQERAVIRSAAVQDIIIGDFQMLALAAQGIYTDDPVTLSGMDYLVSQGILTQARRDEILNTY